MKMPLTKILDIANGIANPKQGASYVLEMLGKRNPQAANTIRQMINTGKNPAEALKGFAQQGQIRKEDLGTIRKVYGMMKNAGFSKFDVDDSIWDDVESCFDKAPTNNTQGWF